MRIIFLCALIFLCKAQIKILSPSQGSEVMEFNARYTLLGNIPWGKTLSGQLYMPKPGDACSQINPLPRNPMVIVESGGCQVITKALQAEILGAKLLLVTEKEGEFNEGDMGHGKLFSFPILSVSPEDGKALRVLASLNEGLAISIGFEMEKRKSSSYELWISASDIKSYEFLLEFESYYYILKSAANMTLHFLTLKCEECKKFLFKDLNNPDCLSGGRYCYTDPDGTGPLHGRAFVLESLRQLCIFEKANEKWFFYIRKYSNDCIRSLEMEKCTGDVMSYLGISKAVIDKCILDSFRGSEHYSLEDNILLSKNDLRTQKKGIHSWPSAIVNENTYLGDLDAVSFFESICITLETPVIGCPGVEVKEVFTPAKSALDLWILILSILSIAFIIIVLLLKYAVVYLKKEVKEEYSSQINESITTFFAFKDRSRPERERMLDFDESELEK